jgi:hypothetical protein
MKSIDADAGECWARWYSTRTANLLRLSGPPPSRLCFDELTLTLECRYAQALLLNPRVHRYLSKNHPEDLSKLQKLLADFERDSRVSIQDLPSGVHEHK